MIGYLSKKDVLSLPQYEYFYTVFQKKTCDHIFDDKLK